MEENVVPAPVPSISAVPTNQDAGAQSPPAQPVDDGWKLWWLGAAIIGVLGPGMWFAAHFRESAAWYVFPLLILSPALLFVSSVTAIQKPTRKVIVAAFLLEIVKVGFLCTYAYVETSRVWASSASKFATILALAFLPFILIFVRSAIVRKTTQDSIRENFYSVLCGVLYLFMHVTYTCTFALALHDQADVEEGLRATQIGRVTYGLFHFSEGKSQIAEAVGLSNQTSEWPLDAMQQRELVHKAKGGKDSERLDELAWNVNEWRKLDVAINTEDQNAVWLVTIVGHASDRLPSTGEEWDNYKYSMERTFGTFGFLDDVMRTKKMRVEWRLRPVSNTDRMILSDFLPGWDHKRSVEVLLQKNSQPTALLDYMYFMIYTITTTGYGDFVPISSQAKFIASVANLFELLFIVVVINLVFAYAKN